MSITVKFKCPQCEAVQVARKEGEGFEFYMRELHTCSTCHSTLVIQVKTTAGVRVWDLIEVPPLSTR